MRKNLQVPVRYVGRLTLNRNVDDFFAETEQVPSNPPHPPQKASTTRTALLYA